MKKSIVCLVSTLVIFVAPVFAFDLGKLVSDVVEKSVNNSIGSVSNTIKNEVEKALSTVMPKVGTNAKRDDGKSINLKKGIVIFGYNGCPYCRKAYAYMKRNNIRYTLMDTQKDAKASRIAKQNGLRGVPVIYVSGEKYTGFSEGGYTKLFKKHGVIK